jgi:hypothetical protein
LIAVFPAAVYRYGKFADRLTVGGIFEFGVSGQPPDQYNMV